MANRLSENKTDLNIDFGMHDGRPLKLLIDEVAKRETKSAGGWVRDLVRAELKRDGVLGGGR